MKLVRWRMRVGVIGCGLIFITGFALSQVSFLPASSAYDGQKVSFVSLIANPHRDLSKLYPLLTQKAGTPYSQKEIEADAAALQNAGHFQPVKVSVVPDVKGLRVEFLLEPAYYLGVMEFPGGTKSFSYIQLLQVTDYSDEEPYDPARIPIEVQALTDFLHRNGYFQCHVRAEPSIDDAHQLVNVRFAITTGKQARIWAIQISGPSEAEQLRLFHSMQSLRARLSRGLLKTGQPYSKERVASAINRMKATLTGEHRLANSIRENPPKYDPSTDTVEVSFTVQMGPIVAVRIQGSRLSAISFLANRRMKSLIPIYSEGTTDPELVDEGKNNLSEYFQKKGYNDVKVSTDVDRKPDRVSVLYKIDRGTKYKVDRILFYGNGEIAAKTLLAQVAVKKSHLWTHGSLSQKQLKQSSSNLETLYRDRGYEDVKVTSRTSPRARSIDVDFDIEEGPQTLVKSVNVSGNRSVPSTQLTRQGFLLKTGAPFSPRKMADDRNRISATYLDRGYLNAEVKANVQNAAGDAHHVNVSYDIMEHQLVRIQQVVYLGKQRTRMSLLKKTARLAPEKPMSLAALLESDSRLYDLNIFDWASVGPRKPITTQEDEVALVKVHEAKRNEITYGFGFEVSHRGGNIPTGTVALPGGGGTIGLNGYQIAPSQATYASPRGLIDFTRHNMRGLGETASASILAARLDQRLLTAYAQPHFFGSEWKSLSSFSLERNSENPLFTAALGDLSFQLERAISRKSNTRVQIRYDFNKTDLSHILVPDLVLPQDRNVRLSTVSGTLIRDTRDKPLDAHRGEFITLNFGITPTALGSSSNFTKFFGQYAFYKPVHSVVLANSIRLGLAAPFASSFVPTSQLFFSGGGTSLRGFPIDEAGPQRLVPFCNVLQGQSGCVNITVPVGGKQLFIFNSEVRFPLGIVKPLGGVFFYDGGNVYSAINLNNFANNYSNTVGFGLRYATPIGPVRFDVGRNLNPMPGLNPWQYFITIGQAF